MVDYKEILIGDSLFFVGWYVVIMIHAIADVIIPILETNLLLSMTGTEVNNVTSILWFGIILIDFLAMIIVPIALIIIGMIKSEQGSNKIYDVVFAVLFTLFTLMFVYFSWYVIPTFITQITSTPYLVVLFWVGLIPIFLLNVVGVPVYTIIKAKQ